jgi:hypothetical protein
MFGATSRIMEGEDCLASRLAPSAALTAHSCRRQPQWTAWSADGSSAEGTEISVIEPLPPSAKCMALLRGMVVVIGQAL